ncbi:MAG TPA: hypothetical protein VKM72_17900 [Thermoanaerobaculia bacterium]|nr:hypothetical protein [Thermoanaerobaculia bacterium]
MRNALRAVRSGQDRILLVLGAISLLLLVPMLWIWIAYGGVRSPALVWVGGIGLSILTAGIGLAMLRLLDGGR